MDLQSGDSGIGSPDSQKVPKSAEGKSKKPVENHLNGTPNNVSHKHSGHKHHHKSSSGDKHKDPNRHKHDKHGGDKPREHSSSAEKIKDPNRSSGEKHSSSKHKEHSSKPKDPNKPSKDHSSKPKDGHHSADKHKHGSEGKHKSSGDKHKERHKDGSAKHSSDKHRPDKVRKEGGSSSSKPKSSGEVKVKTEPGVSEKGSSPTKLVIKKEKDGSQPAVKKEPQDSDDDVPLAMRAQGEKRAHESDSDDEPLAARAEKKKIKKEKPSAEAVARKRKAESDDDDDKPIAKPKPKKKKGKEEKATPEKGKKKAKKEEPEVWKWWEEGPREEGVKWKFLEHKGPVFAPAYEPLPDSVEFLYDGKPMKLSEETEEVAGFFGRMLDHDYVTKDAFRKNFFHDWRKVMTPEERKVITNLDKCDFRQMDVYYKQKSEERKAMTKEQKQEIKKQNEATVEEYGFCNIDGHKQRIGNFKIEPPGLFRGRGDHPKMGMHKKRVRPEDVIINCSKDSVYPKAPPGHKWKEVRHDNSVTWLASWSENIQGSIKYVMLNATSRLKGEKDWMKYETARKLHKCVDRIRAQYREEWKSKEMRIRQRAVALYFIDKLALRAGNEKDSDEAADTVGCCSLRVEHINLHREHEGKEFVVEFDFLGKDSIRYHNFVAVEKKVFKNLQLFKENKSDGDDLFDRLNTTILNKHLQDMMEGLTAKVFRTYNASNTLQQQLQLLTNSEDSVAAKILSYNRANRAVAILCNHQRSVPKTFEKSMSNLQAKIDKKKEDIKKSRKEYKGLKADYKHKRDAKTAGMLERKKKQMERLEEQLMKLEVQATDKEENKEIALGTSKLNYLDPRISVAWCKKWEVPVEKIYNKTQRDKFAWALDMADETFEF
ncbi:DNA topoisomerase I, mitochondrial-like [Branchiostoma floridae]|uniref:DNA topoisomerase I n=1 Tax=Branchiostoma floridae TaxID=7739 RepID=A0A9J7L9R5_BRAFL|nr:DNA topoisomerase I, mitochondrial-like [Branchiostoma floridae]